MTNKTKKVIFLILFILVAIAGTLKLGSYVSHLPPINGTFVGKVGIDTYVYNLSDTKIDQADAKEMWFWLLHGAPGPFQLLESLRIKKIEIINSNFDKKADCGYFFINEYTRFNNKSWGNGRVNSPCP